MPDIVRNSKTPLPFLMTNDQHIDGIEGIAGQITVTLSKADGAFEAAEGTVIETGNGWYALVPAGTDTGALGNLILHAVATGADPADAVFRVLESDPTSVLSSTGTLDVDSTVYNNTVDLDNYFSLKLHADCWYNSDELTRRKAAAEATAIIDRLPYLGYKADSTQILEFPRTINCITQSEIPQAIRKAHAEIVLALLGGADPQKDYEALFVTSQSMFSTKSTYDSVKFPEYVVAGVPSVVAWQLLKPYLRAAQEIRISRV